MGMSTIWAQLEPLPPSAGDPGHRSSLGDLTLWDTEPELSAFLLCPQLPATHRGVCQTNG